MFVSHRTGLLLVNCVNQSTVLLLCGFLFSYVENQLGTSFSLVFMVAISFSSFKIFILAGQRGESEGENLKHPAERGARLANPMTHEIVT